MTRVAQDAGPPRLRQRWATTAFITRAGRPKAGIGDRGPMNKHKIGAVIAAAMLVLTFAGTAFAGSLDWNGKNGWPVANGCNQDDTPPGSMLWIYTGDSDSAV